MEANERFTLQNLIKKELEEFMTSFTPEYTLHDSPKYRISQEIGLINNELSILHESRPELNRIYTDLSNECLSNKRLNMDVLCEKFCMEKGVPAKDREYFIGLRKLYAKRAWLDKQLKLLDEKEQYEKSAAVEKDAREFTLARRILALWFILDEAGKDTNFSTQSNRARIAQFAFFLTSKEGSPKNIRDTSIYATIKYLWGKPERASLEDLYYVKNLFISIGLHNLAANVDVIISSESTSE
jgi:hypothetical protein